MEAHRKVTGVPGQMTVADCIAAPARPTAETLYVVVTPLGMRHHYALSTNGSPARTLCGRPVYRPYGCLAAVPGVEEASCLSCRRAAETAKAARNDC